MEVGEGTGVGEGSDGGEEGMLQTCFIDTAFLTFPVG